MQNPRDERTKAVIFDVDGTVANNDHRRVWVQNKPKNWKAYNATMADDLPIHNIIHLAQILCKHYHIIIVTARSDDHKQTTIDWLEKHMVPHTAIYFRKEKDYRDDAIVKSEILDVIIQDGYNPVMVFDDRNKVVNMWRERGLQCLQVAPGDF